MSTTGEEISVRFVGTSAEAEAASERAAVAITSAVERMKGGFVGLAATSQSAMGEVGVAAEGAAAATEASAGLAEGALARWGLSMRGLGRSATEAREQVAVQFGAMAGIMEHLNAIILGVGVALAGGAMFKEAVDAATEFDTHTLKLSKTLGITLEAASGLHTALHGLGIETDTYTGAALRLTRQLRTHEDQLNKIGVVTRDAGGHLLNMQEIMTNTIDVLRNMKEGTDRNLAAQVAFGRGAGDLTQMLRLNKQEMDEGAEVAKRLGLILGVDGVKALVDYKKAHADAELTMLAVNVAIGRALLPTLTRLGNWFTENGPEIMKFCRDVGTAFDWMGQIIETGALTIASTLFSLKIVIMAVIDIVRTLGIVMLDVLSGNWARIGADWDAGWTRLERRAIAGAKEIKKAWDDAIDRANAVPKPGAYNDPTTGAGDTIDPNALKKGPKEKAAKAPKEKKSAEAQDALDTAAIIKDANKAVTEFMTEEERKRTGLAQEGIKEREAAGLGEIAMAEEHAKHETEMGRTTKAQLLQQEIAFAAQRRAIELKALDDEAMLAQSDVVKSQQIADKKLAVERKYQLDVQKLRDQAETKQAVKQNAYLSQMSNAWGQALAKMATLQDSFGTTLQSMWQGLVGTIESAIAKMVESWIVGLFTKEIASKSFHLKEVLQTAKQAAAHAYNAVVGIPVVGPVLAPVAAGVAFAGVAAFSAEGGYDIPAGVNPVTQLHAREMVLPAHIADPLRAILASGGSAAASAGGDVHVHVSTIDSRGFEQLLQRDRHKVASAVRAAVRDGFKPA